MSQDGWEYMLLSAWAVFFLMLLLEAPAVLSIIYFFVLIALSILVTL